MQNLFLGTCLLLWFVSCLLQWSSGCIISKIKPNHKKITQEQAVDSAATLHGETRKILLMYYKKISLIID